MSKSASSNHATGYHSKADRFLYHHESSSKKIQRYKKNPAGLAFLVSPQNISKKSQGYEKTLNRSFAQMAVMPSDAFSCTTPTFIQATRKACLPSRRASFLLLKAEKQFRKTRQVSVSELYPPLQPAGNTPLDFTTNRSQSATVSRRKVASHPRHPRHPWSSSAFLAFSAAKSSPRLRVFPSPRLPQ